MRTTIFFYRSSPRRRSRNESNNGAYNSILSRTLRECRFTKGRVIRKYLATVERCFFIATINLAFEPSRCIVDNDRVLEDDLSYNKGGTRSVIYCSPSRSPSKISSYQILDSIERSPTLSSAERSTSSFSFRDSVSPFHFAFAFSSVFSTAFNRGTMDRGDSSFLGSPLSLVSSGRELYRECLQGLSSHPSQRFVLTYALVPLSPCSYPTLARTRDARGGRKTCPRSWISAIDK